MKRINNSEKITELIKNLSYWEYRDLWWKFYHFKIKNIFYWVDYPFQIKNCYFKIDNKKIYELKVEEGIWNIKDNFIYFDFNIEKLPKSIKVFVDLGFDDIRELTISINIISSFYYYDIKKHFEKLPKTFTIPITKINDKDLSKFIFLNQETT